MHVNSDYLADDRLTTRTPQGQVPVTETLNVHGHDHVYAIGDITDIAEAKMAGYAMQHAEVVARFAAAFNSSTTRIAPVNFGSPALHSRRFR